MKIVLNNKRFWRSPYIVFSMSGSCSKMSPQALSSIALHCSELEVRHRGDVIANVAKYQKKYDSLEQLINHILMAIPLSDRAQLRVGLANNALLAYLAACYTDHPHLKVIPESKQQKMINMMPVDALNCILPNAAAYLLKHQVTQLGMLDSSLEKEFEHRFGEIATALVALKNNRFHGGHKWKMALPDLLIKSSYLPSEQWLDRNTLDVFDRLYKSINKQLHERRLVCSTLLLEQVLDSGEVKRTIIDSREEIKKLLLDDCVQIRLIATEIAASSLSSDILTWLSPFKSAMFSSLATLKAA